MAYRPLQPPKIGTKLQLYRNRTLLGKTYSLRSKGCVLGHWDASKQGTLVLENVRFHVSRQGRSRVRRTKMRNVHAWVSGAWSTKKATKLHPVSYDPYSKFPFFTVGGIPTPMRIDCARYLVLNRRGLFVSLS